MGKSAAATFLHSQAETLTMQRRAAVCVPGTWVPAEPGIIFHLGQEYMCLPVLAVLYFLETSQAAILPVKPLVPVSAMLWTLLNDCIITSSCLLVWCLIKHLYRASSTGVVRCLTCQVGICETLLSISH